MRQILIASLLFAATPVMAYDPCQPHSPIKQMESLLDRLDRWKGTPQESNVGTTNAFSQRFAELSIQANAYAKKCQCESVTQATQSLEEDTYVNSAAPTASQRIFIAGLRGRLDGVRSAMNSCRVPEAH